MCVLSEKSLDMVIFPFISSEGLLVNAIRIPFPFPDDRHSCIVCIVALLVHPRKIQLCVRCPGIKTTETKQRLQLVLYRNEMEELMKKLKKEKREMLEDRREKLKHAAEIEKLKKEIEELKSKC